MGIGVARRSVIKWIFASFIAALVFRFIPSVFLLPLLESGGLSPVSEPYMFISSLLVTCSEISIVACGALIALTIFNVHDNQRSDRSGKARYTE